MTRRLATVEQIASLSPIPGADLIELARVRGWDVIVKKGDFKPGDLCVYFEVDSMLDVTKPQFSFLAKKGIRTACDGVTGHVLKTMRLRGVYSNGLALPLSAFPEIADHVTSQDVTELLAVRLWDPPMPACLSGQVNGPLPSWVAKTDAERVQNLPDSCFPFEALATEKIDGASVTYTIGADDVFRVCSRQYDLKESDKSTLWQLARKLDVEFIARTIHRRYTVVIQGEVYGHGIQDNPLRLFDQRFAAFSLIVDGVRRNIEYLKDLGLPIVPQFGCKFLIANVGGATDMVDGLYSKINPTRQAEGVVFERQDFAPIGGHVKVKVLNNKLLSKTR